MLSQESFEVLHKRPQRMLTGNSTLQCISRTVHNISAALVTQCLNYNTQPVPLPRCTSMAALACDTQLVPSSIVWPFGDSRLATADRLPVAEACLGTAAAAMKMTMQATLPLVLVIRSHFLLNTPYCPITGLTLPCSQSCRQGPTSSPTWSNCSNKQFHQGIHPLSCILH